MKISMLLVLAATFSAGVAAAETPPLLRALVNSAGFSKSEIASMGDGVLSREIATQDSSRSAAFAGLVRISGDGSGFADTLATIDLSEVPGAADGFGRFGDPPAPADVASLRFADDEFEVLSECKPGACKFKMSKEGLARLSEVDWNDPRAGDAFTRIFREEVQAYVAEYRVRGRDALVVYADKSRPVSISSTIDTLMKQFPEFERYAPRLAAHFVSYPVDRRTSVSDTLVWSMKNFGYRPTIAVDHVMTDRDPEPAGVSGLIAIKTIYANHYLAGRIQLAALLKGDVALGVPGHYVLLVDHILFDDALNGFKRNLLGRGLRQDVEARMQMLRSLADR